MNWSDGESYITVGMAVAVIRYTRKLLETETRLPRWDIYFKNVWLSGFVLMALGEVFPDPWLIWYQLIIIGSVYYTVWQLPAFRPAKMLLLGIAPYSFLIVFKDLLRHLARTFYKTNSDYFDAASTFAFIWLATFLFIANSQKKALAKEQLEREKEAEQRRIIEAKKNELEYLVAERTAEITRQKEELEQALVELKATQSQLIHSEKMASLGELTAGIAHEIQNPLNFVNNFSEVSIELIDELSEEQAKGDRDVELEAELLTDLKQNLQKITQHGNRAASIVKGMLQHSRASTGQREPTDLNALADEYLRLAYHGLRAKDKTFNAQLKTELDASLGTISVIPQDIGRVLLNLFTNAFYAVHQRQRKGEDPAYQPTVTVHTQCVDNEAVISVSDNGTGIPEELQSKIFQPFFTTKPTGEGTGLGLSLAYDIVTKGHNGTMTVESREGEGTTFTIALPA
ncbi:MULTISPECIES: ATP-binding protein [unclassified Spirosoma]|uniref:sensor histidine kinase n=1 Tax=unclassified Spirosoma TaxID=2621999 RepID=UPI000969ECA7|nr:MULTISPECIES: ATP-binding protein [unclassified Spirosoma]MBN8822992.1 histidine kinase [Spirosoma sp.]OJW73097.1 MAG: histidine kinase [Spirosoma sp. 48-14]